MRWLRLLLLAITAPLASAATFVWSGGAGDGAYGNPANWSGGVVPPNDGSAVLVFGDSGAGSVRLSGTLNVSQIRFENSAAAPYAFSGASLVTVQDGFVSGLGGGRSTFLGSVALNLPDAQTFSLNSGLLEINGPVFGSGAVTKSGAGNLKLTGLNLWTGGLTHTSGTLTLGPLGNVGLGTLRLAGGDLALPLYDDAMILNPVVLQANTRITGSHDHFGVFAGPVTLASSVTLTTSGASAVFITGSVQESGGAQQLTVSGLAPVVLYGPSRYSGGTRVENGALIFGSQDAVPDVGTVRASALGYVGAAFSDQVQTAMLDRLDRAEFRGIIGFDTSPREVKTSTFSAPIDLTSLDNYASIGSRTEALLTGAVTVKSGEDYRFGGGGGTLYLASGLSSRGRDLRVISPFGQPLTLVLRGANQFFGSTHVLYSVLVLDRANALPGSSALDLDGPGYIGATENAGMSSNAFLGRISRIGSSQGIAGLDSASAQAPRTITESIDLSLGGTRTDPYYLGTSSRVTLTGSITPTVGDALYLTAVKGGYLTVASTLGSNVPGLVVGQRNGFDAQGGTVELTAQNTFSGGTQVLGGTLRVGQSGSLGTGGVALADRATLYLDSGVRLTNSLALETGARLAGTGTFAPAGGFTLASGQLLTPGGTATIGTLQFGTGLTLGGGSILEIDVRYAGSGAYSNDRLAVSGGALTFAASSGAPITVSLYSLWRDGELGALSTFDPNQNYSWEFATASSLIGFDPTLFTVDTSHFANSLGARNFSVAQSGNSLVLNFAPVPEPSTYVLFGLGFAAVLLSELRRRRR